MSAADVIAGLAGRGIHLSDRDGGIFVRPARMLDAAERDYIRDNKAEILQVLILARSIAIEDPEPARAPRSCFGTCPACGKADWLREKVPLACRCGYQEPARFGAKPDQAEPRWPFPYDSLGSSLLVERMRRRTDG
ncbi:MAG: hypothetical protein FJZ01_14845 [Candidatus Sericytochromatia bacterium]|nr:hypothetical protein [Candidatus Tanganyikabacteria bacterium]